VSEKGTIFLFGGTEMELKIEYLPIKALKPYEKNTRKHQKKDVDNIARSIEKYGMCDAIGIWGERNIIVEGHGRMLACKQLGMTEVPCVRLDHLTDEQRREYAIAHNATAELSEWDLDILPDELAELDLSDFDFDFGIEDDEEETEIVEDEAPEVDEDAEPIAKLGDIWRLGRHRLMCGDSTDKETVELLMNGNKADIAFTSPPYNAGSLNIVGNETTKAKYNSYDDNKTELDYFDFIKTNLSLLLDNANEVFYNIGLVENNKRPIIMLQNEFIDKFKDIIYWEKSTVAPHIQNGVINNLVEFILCFGNGKRKFENAQFSQGTYWNVIKGANASGNEYSKIHKATFPVYLPSNIIENFSPKTGTVIDCFGGTGTTLIACEQLDRTCYMMELDPKYCDVIIKRWETLTGEKAVLING
jgi:site-specific DNA-methyltransferase (adenine-specific)